MTIINNALSGAVAAQAALNTTSQNVANLQTKGYTRQGVLLTAVAPGIGTQSAGYGVKLSGMLRFSDSYKSQQLWRSNAELGQYTQQQPYLTQLEQVMGDDKSSLSNGIDNFFKALNAVGEEPTSAPLRGQVVAQAGALAESFNSIYQVTRNQQISVQQQRDAILPKFNTLVANIASLNKSIAAAGALGTNTSGLIDERDLAIDSLSQLAAIEVLEQPDGSRTVSLKTGQPLVVGTMAGMLQMDTSSGTPKMEVAFGNSDYAVDDSRIGGQLGGLGNFERNTLLPLQQSIMSMSEQLADKINTQLAAGTDSAGNPGIPLFVKGTGGVGGILSVTPGYTSDNLALSMDGTPGDSSNLQLLVDIKNQAITLPSVGTVIIGDADTQLVGKLGIDSQQNKSLLNTATTIRRQAEDDWAATSGVNKDEEAMNLVEFQNMYQANMKVIAVANNLFDATLSMFG
ncbi:flagellar hook-associated protein 1 FlgK [Pseudoduganella flava]|uniref:Flagellar hook-associated protein 1 n=1 Tax=Pseudoduganella flava TaxID=871742 RepID=A0A562Q024_9BURK|nr:flagellar hook-associated protein FlgK [Pseudoduganella flava]QGZ38452.1 flagellar hook-associated protein FlgK [Pseudoduganella flava]TWI49998.1 flagellar hook-associated protein 1 FlgK [Pseudoduganella flava]